MGLVEISLIYGAITSLFKDSVFIVISAMLFAVVCIAGLLVSPMGFVSGIQITIAAWMCFNLGLFTWILLPGLVAKRAS